jgi:hypothetical protein
MVNLIKSPPSHRQATVELPKHLLAPYQDFIKVSALLDREAQLLAFEGKMAKARLLVLAGRLIYSYQALLSELGWSLPHLRAQSDEGEAIILTQIGDNFLFLLLNPCLEGKTQLIIDSLGDIYRGKGNKQFFKEVEKQFCELVGPMGKVIIQNQIKLNRDLTPEKLISTLLDILKKYQINPQKIKKFQQLTFSRLS